MATRGFIAAIGHGLRGAGDAAVGFGVWGGFSEAAGDLLLNLGSAQVTRFGKRRRALLARNTVK